MTEERGDRTATPFAALVRALRAEQEAGCTNRASGGPFDQVIRGQIERVARALPADRRGPLRQAYRLFRDYAFLPPAQRARRVRAALAVLEGRGAPGAEEPALPAGGTTSPGGPGPAPGTGAPPAAMDGRVAAAPPGTPAGGHPARALPPGGNGTAAGITPETPLAKLPGVGRRTAQRLARLGLTTAGDLLWHVPRRYEDRSRWKRIGDLLAGETATVRATVMEAEPVRTRSGRALVRVTVTDGSGRLEVVFFNQPFRLQQMRPGRSVLLSGRVQPGYRGLRMEHPEVEFLEGDDDVPVHTARIVPVYPATEGAGQRLLRGLAWRVVGPLADRVPEILPDGLRRSLGLPERSTALRDIHFPPDEERLEAARRRLAFEEWFVMQVALARIRGQKQELPGRAHRPDGPRVARFLAGLPFQLTPAQQRVIDEIRRDMESPRPMRRLVQGDVGSGKTVVAAWALVKAAESGGQAALMAPTEILAEQHGRRLRELLRPAGLEVALLTGSQTAAEREGVLAGLAAGSLPVVVGTHALIQEPVRFADLGLVVIDEQHRFGVRQRALLQDKGRVPDLLVMTATPIPRSLALTLYGDLDLSVIDQLPPGRKPVRTVWLPERQRRRAYDLLAARAAAGEQGYVVCPLVDEPDEESGAADAGVKAVKPWAEYIARRYPRLRVGLLHGRMPGAEKERIMSAFEQGRLDVLVATTVIEVGVDVPNATVMIIEGADRFGLAQLHQLRGRVGRGGKEALCVLVADPRSEEGRRRLDALCRTQSGFEIAEFDLELRGPGDFFGTRQHGLPALRIADPVRDAALLRQAREAARALLQRDPELRRPEHAALRQEVLSRYGTFLAEARALWS